MYRLRQAVIAAFAAIAWVACSPAQADSPTKHRTAPADPTAESARYAWDRDVRALTFTVAANANQAAAWYAEAERQEAERAAEAEAARQRAAANTLRTSSTLSTPRTSSSPKPPSSVGGACGGSSRDYVIPKESGGNPNARNASGAWGCYQIMPGTWSSSCSDLGQHGSASTDAQAKCADRLPPSAWAASQGG